jgi:hypothetical protein
MGASVDEAYDFRGGLRWGRAGIASPLGRMTVSPHLLTIGPAPAVSISFPRPPEVQVNKQEVRVVEVFKPWWRLQYRVLVHGHSEPAPIVFTTFKAKAVTAALEQHGWPAEARNRA